MKLDIFNRDGYWAEAELCALTIDNELIPYERAFVPLDYLDTPTMRLQYLKLLFRSGARPTGATLTWVEDGGRLNTEITLLGPTKKASYC